MLRSVKDPAYDIGSRAIGTLLNSAKQRSEQSKITSLRRQSSIHASTATCQQFLRYYSIPMPYFVILRPQNRHNSPLPTPPSITLPPRNSSLFLRTILQVYDHSCSHLRMLNLDPLSRPMGLHTLGLATALKSRTHPYIDQ